MDGATTLVSALGLPASAAEKPRTASLKLLIARSRRLSVCCATLIPDGVMLCAAAHEQCRHAGEAHRR